MFPDMLSLLQAIANGDEDAIRFAEDMGNIADMNGEDHTAKMLFSAANAGRKLSLSCPVEWAN